MLVLALAGAGRADDAGAPPSTSAAPSALPDVPPARSASASSPPAAAAATPAACASATPAAPPPATACGPSHEPSSSRSSSPVSSTSPASSLHPTRGGERGAAEPRVELGSHRAAAGHATRRVRRNARVEIHARDLRLEADAMDRLERIAARYYARTHRRLIITGGQRPPQLQARLMLEKLVHGDDLLRLYENTAAVREIRAVYRDGAARRVPRSVLARRIRATILAQMARGVFVSKHLSATAADVRSRGMTPAQEHALRASVAEEPGVQLLDERGGPEPHFHLDLLATPAPRADEPAADVK
jgi:hypothetical protein